MSLLGEESTRCVIDFEHVVLAECFDCKRGIVINRYIASLLKRESKPFVTVMNGPLNSRLN